MRVAFTLDDIPLWPRSHPPDGYSVASIMQKISDALVRNGIRDAYGFGNSWSLVQHPELATVLDAWVAAGHHVGNHTHSHLVLTEISWELIAARSIWPTVTLRRGFPKRRTASFATRFAIGVTPRRNALRCWRISPLRTTSQPMFQAGGTNGTGIELGVTPEIALIPGPRSNWSVIS
jgi:hypothetical protein